jgi:site-specific DNA-adenine methylase
VVKSNSNTDFIKKLYKEYIIDFVQANRFINSKSNNRNKIDEVLIRGAI